MTKADFLPGDLVQRGGKRYVVGDRKFWGGGQFIWGWPATKSGKADGRKDGYYLDPSATELIKRAETK